MFEENGIKYQKFGNIQWYTNLDIPKRHAVLDLRGNYYRSKLYNKYYNYNAIDVPKIMIFHVIMMVKWEFPFHSWKALILISSY